MFEKFKVFTKAELESRAEIKYEAYAKAINIEARTMIDMASKQFLPAFIKYTKTLADTVLAVKEAGVDAAVQTEALKEVSALLAETKAALDVLVKVTDEQQQRRGRSAGEHSIIQMLFRLWKHFVLRSTSLR